MGALKIKVVEMAQNETKKPAFKPSPLALRAFFQGFIVACFLLMATGLLP